MDTPRLEWWSFGVGLSLLHIMVATTRPGYGYGGYYGGYGVRRVGYYGGYYRPRVAHYGGYGFRRVGYYGGYGIRRGYGVGVGRVGRWR